MSSATIYRCHTGTQGHHVAANGWGDADRDIGGWSGRGQKVVATTDFHPTDIPPDECVDWIIDHNKAVIDRYGYCYGCTPVCKDDPCARGDKVHHPSRLRFHPPAPTVSAPKLAGQQYFHNFHYRAPGPPSCMCTHRLLAGLGVCCTTPVHGQECQV